MSDILVTAEETISGAEVKLRGMMQTALTKQRYADVARLAPLADGLLNILRMARNGDASSPTSVIADPVRAENHAIKSDGKMGRAPSTKNRLPEPSDPRIERPGDRLVKIAWSKKDRREYEHRAAADIIFRIAELFERDRSPGVAFMMDGLMPFKTGSGADIPSYQAYLALAWFRSLGAIEPRGKDGYAVVVDNLRTRVKSAWDSLPDALSH
jgi:hypothetical protein